MNAYEQLIHQFYTSFKNLDAAGMKACYSEQVHFSDPAFPDLNGAEAGAMWAMLIGVLKKNPADWKLEYTDVQVTDSEGSCRWEAQYTFSLTGRKVHNRIHATFRFENEKIVAHHDSFDFYRWARMAFGVTGWLLGWTPFFRKKLQTKTSARLKAYMSKA